MKKKWPSKHVTVSLAVFKFFLSSLFQSPPLPTTLVRFRITTNRRVGLLLSEALPHRGSSKPLAGLRALDVGCGGGLLTEVLLNVSRSLSSYISMQNTFICIIMTERFTMLQFCTRSSVRYCPSCGNLLQCKVFVFLSIWSTAIKNYAYLERFEAFKAEASATNTLLTAVLMPPAACLVVPGFVLALCA